MSDCSEFTQAARDAWDRADGSVGHFLLPLCNAVDSLQQRVAELEEQIDHPVFAYRGETLSRDAVGIRLMERDDLQQRVGELEKERDESEKTRRAAIDAFKGQAEKVGDLDVKLAEVVKATSQFVDFAPAEWRAWYDEITKDIPR